MGALANGGAQVLDGTAAGLTGSGGQLLTQDSPWAVGVVERDDEFGFAVGAGDVDIDSAADLAAGVSELSAVPGAGALVVLPGSTGGLNGIGSQLFTQDSPGVPDSVEFDDFLGEALAASGS